MEKNVWPDRTQYMRCRGDINGLNYKSKPTRVLLIPCVDYKSGHRGASAVNVFLNTGESQVNCSSLLSVLYAKLRKSLALPPHVCPQCLNIPLTGTNSSQA